MPAFAQHDHLPRNATDFEKSVSLSVDPAPKFDNAFADFRRRKLLTRPEAWWAWLIWEYGLQEIDPYVEDKIQLLDEGIDWQRIRGTRAATDLALTWQNVTAVDEDFPTRRTHWNRWMLGLDAYPANEVPLLRNIDALANLSAPLRSNYWRGFHYHDVRALELGWTKLGETLLGEFSGVRHSDTGEAKWSFGRPYIQEATLSQAELEQLSAWIDSAGTYLPWGQFSWEEANATWSDPAATARNRLVLQALMDRPVWLELRDSGDAILGYRRARACHMVSPVAATLGSYVVSGNEYAVDRDNGIRLYIEAMTDFGEGVDFEVASWGLVWDATIIDATKPGQMFALPNEIENVTPPVAVANQSISFNRTTRERFVALLNIAS